MPPEQPPTGGKSEAPSSTTATASGKVSALEILKVYTRISLSGFGGTLFWVRYMLVERKGWLTEREFVEALALGQLVPGPSVLNMSLMISYRFAGYAGALAAGVGFLGCPFLMVIGIGMLYGRYEHILLVQQALSGMIAVAVGLLIANCIKMASALPRHWRPWLFTLLAFAGVGVLRWPLIGVLGVLAPFGIAAVWKDRR